ncbi:MAG: exonuclease SbcCD subunit D [Clostridiaceae bacterium]
MKILHTGDWHLGKIVNQVHMTQDQEHILDRLMKIIEEEKPDVLVISGDIYDRSVPPVEAVELLDKTLNRILLKGKIPVLAVAGNHDSSERIDFGSRLMETRGFYIEGTLKDDIRKVVLKDQWGNVNFYLMPYADPAVVRNLYKDDSIRSHDDAFKAVINRIKENMAREERNVLICHGYVRGAAELETSESERPLTMGGTEYVEAGIFGDFEYTALGHLHSPQKVTGQNIRYAGSLLKYSFSEVKQRKSAILVNLGDKGSEIVVDLKPLKPLKDMRIIKGELKELIKIGQEESSRDYIKAILTDEGELMDPMNKLRQVYPNILELVREGTQRTNGDARTSAGEGYRQKSKLELFRSFYENISGIELSDEKEEIIARVIDQAEKEEREAGI